MNPVDHFVTCCVCLNTIDPGQNPVAHHWEGNFLLYCHEGEEKLPAANGALPQTRIADPSKYPETNSGG